MALQSVRPRTWIAMPTLAVVLFACGNGGARVAPVSALSPSASITTALARIAKKVHLPIELPTGLPPGIRLASEHPVNILDYGPKREVGVLNLEFGRARRLAISYGAPSWAGCDYPSYGARQVRVGNLPALLLVHRGRGASILWPATLRKLQGRYELSGTFSGPEILRLAESMRPVPGLAPIEPPPGC